MPAKPSRRRRLAGSIAVYYGRFPVEELKLLVLPVEGRGVPYGQTWGDPAAIHIRAAICTPA